MIEIQQNYQENNLEEWIITPKLKLTNKENVR